MPAPGISDPRFRLKKVPETGLPYVQSPGIVEKWGVQKSAEGQDPGDLSGEDLAGLLRQVAQDRKNWVQVSDAMQGAIAKAETLARARALENEALLVSLNKAHHELVRANEIIKKMEGEKKRESLAKEKLRGALLTSTSLRLLVLDYFQISDSETPRSLHWGLGMTEALRKMKKWRGK